VASVAEHHRLHRHACGLGICRRQLLGARSFFTHTAHYSAAITMFVCFLGLVILDAISYKIHKDPAVDIQDPLRVKVKATFADALMPRNPFVALLTDPWVWSMG
jgi:hypothetical protein